MAGIGGAFNKTLESVVSIFGGISQAKVAEAEAQQSGQNIRAALETNKQTTQLLMFGAVALAGVAVLAVMLRKGR